MDERENDVAQQDNRTLTGAGEADTSGPATAEGGTTGDGVTEDAGGVGMLNSATTEDGGVAVAGGKLAGHVDDFNGELEDRRLKNVPGADPNNQVVPPNDRDLRQ
ncbi:MAG: hypothetical protein ACAH95_06115 [Fimbriimonas sp.]